MFKVGLTGNYYSGQNEVSKIMSEFDVPVFNANLVTKFLINHSPDHIEKILSKFGSNSYNMGLLDLKKFNTNKSFDDLFDIIELDLLKSYELFRIKHKKDFYTIFLFDYLFERGLDSLMNFNINCYRPRYYRIYDMQTLTSFPLHTIEKIVTSEMDESVKNSKSDYIIRNYNANGDYKSDIVIGLESQIKTVHKRIMDKKMDSDISNHYPSTREILDYY
jgi:dephospho-CoA kinase